MVIRRTVIFLCVWTRVLSSVSADPSSSPKDSLTGNASNLSFNIDFANPIDVPAVKNPDAAEPSRSASLREERNAPIVLFDDDRDRLRQEQISLMQNDRNVRRNTNKRRIGEEINERRTSMKLGFNGNGNKERERDRFHHSKSSSQTFNVNRFESPSTPKDRRRTNDVQKRIKQEREDEIRREVQKSFEIREKILRDKKMQTLSNRKDWSGRDRRLNSIGPETPVKVEVDSKVRNQRDRDRAAHSIDKTTHKVGNIVAQRERDRAAHEKMDGQNQRERDREMHDQSRIRRNRLPLLEREDSAYRREDKLAKRYGDPGISLERREKERRERISLALTRNQNENKWYDNTPQNIDHYYNMRPSYGVGMHKHNSERYQNHQNTKPPILIVEKIPVPVTVLKYHDREPSTEEDTIVQRPISTLYDERGASRPAEGFYMDRRPERPGTSPQDNSEESIYVEKGIILGPPHPIHFAQGPLYFENLGPPIQLPVNLNEVAEIAISNHVAQASELEKFHQATTLSEIARLNRIKLAHALHEHINAEGLAAHVANKQAQVIAAHAQAQSVAEHVANNQAQAYAIQAHAQGALEQAASNQAITAHAINEQVNEANIQAQAAAENAASTEALKEQAILEETLKHELILKNRLVNSHEEIAAAQEVDLIYFAIKNGIKNALKTQISSHLKNKILTSKFFHHLQAIEEELIQRLDVLRPYFQSGPGGYVVPEEIPALPSGAPISSAELQKLPKVHLTPTSLITPGYKFPKEMLLGTNSNLDIRFVEYILRLPEPQFFQIMQIPKGEFLLALFPQLNRELFDDISFNHHQGLRVPNPHNHGQDSEEIIRHNHYHIHHDSPISTSSRHIQTIQPDIKTAFAENHFRQHDGSKFLSNTPSLQFNAPESQYRESSYVNYDPKLFGKHDDPPNYSNLHHGKVDDTTSKSYTALTLTHFATTAAPSATPVIRGIQVRPKGYEPHHYSNTPISQEKNTQQDIWTTSTPSSILTNTYELSVLPGSDPVPKEQITIPVHKHSVTKTISHSNKKDYSSIPTIPPQLVINSNNYIIKFPQTVSKDKDIVLLNTQMPSKNNIPHVVSPLSFIETSTPSYAITTTSFSDIPYQSTIPFTHPQSMPISLSHPSEIFERPTFNEWPFVTNFFTKDTKDQSNVIEGISSFTPTESPLFTSLTDDPSVSAPIDTTQDGSNDGQDVVIPFRGFSGNVRQKTVFEKLAEQIDRENELPRKPGTDENDDDHVVSLFRKKKGNVTDFNVGRTKVKLTEKENKNSGQLSQEEKRRLGITNFRGGISKTSDELIIDKIKEITRTTVTRPQETPTIVKFAGANSKPIANLFFHDPLGNLSNSGSDNITISPSQNPMPISTEARRSSKQHNTKLLDFGSSSTLPGEPPSKSSKQNKIQTFSARKPPRPKRVESTPAPFVDINGTPTLESYTFPAEVVRRTEPYPVTRKNFTSIVENVFKNLPSYLRKEPDCSVVATAKRAFCLYPAGYPQNAAEQLVAKYKNVIEEGIEILRSLPESKIDMKLAKKQVPSLDSTVSCETENKSVKLSWSRDVFGSWFTVLQSGSFQQVVNVTTCGSSARIKGCQPLLQPRPLIVFHPEDQNARPLILEFPLPIGCVFVSQ